MISEMKALAEENRRLTVSRASATRLISKPSLPLPPTSHLGFIERTTGNG